MKHKKSENIVKPCIMPVPDPATRTSTFLDIAATTLPPAPSIFDFASALVSLESLPVRQNFRSDMDKVCSCLTFVDMPLFAFFATGAF